MRFGKVAFSIFMLGLGVYILVPTADELAIHPLVALFLDYVFHIPFLTAILISIILYRVIGVLCIVSALAVGGKPAYHLFKDKLKTKLHRKPH
jgi:hypothetical protein